MEKGNCFGRRAWALDMKKRKKGYEVTEKKRKRLKGVYIRAKRM